MRLFGWLARFTRRDKTYCCQEIADLSSDYIDESLPPSIADHFRTHMNSCPQCNTFYATFRATVLTLRDLPKRSAPPDLKTRIHSRLASEHDGGKPGASV